MTVTDRLHRIRERIARAAERVKRSPDEIRLVAVSKRQPVERMQEALTAGLFDLGENRVQEAVEKSSFIQHPNLRWHMIGHLQRNKVKPACRLFHVIHSLDSLRLAGTLEQELEKIGRSIDIFIQIKLSPETAKTGIDPREAIELATFVHQSAHLQAIGLMTMPPYTPDPEESRPYFEQLRHIRDRLNHDVFHDTPVQHLSMGMSHDFEVAIEEGATYLRIGTSIFGERDVHR